MSLPPEIIVDIFLKLPVKPLLRFRCLSKSMCSTIDDSDFIKAHLNRSIETNTHKKLILFGHTKTSTVISGIYAVDLSDGLKESVKLDNSLNHGRFSVIDCCSGLFLLLEPRIINSLNTVKLVLWNPFTKRYKRLTDPPVESSSMFKPLQQYSYRYFDSFGLGYDAARNDHKVVRILYEKPKEVWIYSLRSDSWRKVEDWCQIALGVMGMFVNGVMYFEGENLENIVSFDFATEKFSIMPFPEGYEKSCSHLRVLEGRLCLCTLGRHRTLDIYVGDKHEDGLTWSKLIKIPDYQTHTDHIRNLRPLCYSREGDKILLIEERDDFVWYDLNKKTTESIQTVCDIKKHYRLKFFNLSNNTTCWESLVSLG
ncbi:hypothetical protein JCGZ_02919 [Jatropha curcas]|uniref:F-box domain-containing protein n=1 Tax=Jatropha curcas TaxID=180498 RepID=A0A067LDN8_JATCU|nr:F-box protein CPR1 [Jatropha curcas]KDP42189.1 hypothetical protein JCGZ_02919 [Jatropha curcas]